MVIIIPRPVWIPAHIDNARLSIYDRDRVIYGVVHVSVFVKHPVTLRTHTWGLRPILGALRLESIQTLPLKELGLQISRGLYTIPKVFFT